MHEVCVAMIGLFGPKFIAIRIYLVEISPKKTHLPNCSARSVQLKLLDIISQIHVTKVHDSKFSTIYDIGLSILFILLTNCASIWLFLNPLRKLQGRNSSNDKFYEC